MKNQSHPVAAREIEKFNRIRTSLKRRPGSSINRYVRTGADAVKLLFLAIDAASGKTIEMTFGGSNADSRVSECRRLGCSPVSPICYDRIATAMRQAWHAAAVFLSPSVSTKM